METNIQSHNAVGEPLSFEKVWFLFQDTDKKFKETEKMFQDTDTKFKDTDAKFKEMHAESLRLEKRMAREMRELKTLFTGQWGALVESLVEGKVVSMLQERGIDIKSTYTNLRDKDESMEFDIVAANGTDIVVIEVKTKFKLDDLEYFCEKLPKFRGMSEHYTNKRIYGAIAFLKADPSIARKAEKLGLFVMRAVGDSARIVNNENFAPKAW